MKLKTNKSFSKRVNISKNGKLKRRSPGHNAFQSKHNSAQNVAKKSIRNFIMKIKDRARFLPGS